MLDHYKEIYNQELSKSENELEYDVLNSSATRAFVYEVCKKCLEKKYLDVTISLPENIHHVELFLGSDGMWCAALNYSVSFSRAGTATEAVRMEIDKIRSSEMTQ